MTPAPAAQAQAEAPPGQPAGGGRTKAPTRPQRSRSSPQVSRGLDVVSAHEKAYGGSPAFTIRQKTAFGDEGRYRMTGGEAGRDLSDKYDQIRPRAPQYTMVSRASGIPKPELQPGPGEYTLPSTLYGSHPALPVPGRVPKTTARRSLPTDGLDVTPGPLDYQTVQAEKFGRVDQAAVPKYTMRSKLVDPSSKEVRPGPYEVGMCGRNGIMTTPSWSMVSRSSGIPKPSLQPGPGDYALPSTLYGSHPALPMAGRVPRSTAERFSSKVEERPY